MNVRASRFTNAASRVVNVGLAPKTDPDSVDTRAIFRAFKRRLPLIGIASIVAGILVYIVVGLGASSYTATAKLMLDVRKTQIITADEIVADVDPSEQLINSELAVLRSPLVVERALSRLSPSQIALFDPTQKPPSMVSRLKSTIKGLISSPGPTASAEEQAAERQQILVSTLRGKIKAYAERRSYVMVIEVDAETATLARDIANATVQSYIDVQLEGRRAAVRKATAWLEDRLAELEREVETTETSVTEFQAQSLLLDGATLDSVSKQLVNLNAQLTIIKSERVEAEARLSQLASVLRGAGAVAAARLVDTPSMLQLREKELELRQADAVWARSQPSTQAGRAAIRAELEDIQSVMAEEVDSELALRRSEADVARLREDGLQRAVSELDAQIVQINSNQLDLRQLQREAEASRNTYESLLGRIADARAQREMQEPDTVLIQAAVAPLSPSTPRPKIFAAMATFVTFAALITIVFFREISPSTFRGMRELEDETGLPVLASLPAQGWQASKDMLNDLSKNAFSRYAERVRQLRTSVNVGRQSTEGHSVMILSSAPEEGKTTTTLAYARMAALGGAETIVVDCDLRRPSVAKALGIENDLDHDFIDLINCRCNIGDAIYSSREQCFDVLAARAPDASAADDLKASWIGPMIQSLTEIYDVVLIDAPALLAVPDAMTLVENVDTTLYLVNFDKTPRSAVQRGLKRLAIAGAGVSGLILNKVDSNRSHDALEEGYGYEI